MDTLRVSPVHFGTYLYKWKSDYRYLHKKVKMKRMYFFLFLIFFFKLFWQINLASFHFLLRKANQTLYASIRIYHWWFVYHSVTSSISWKVWTDPGPWYFLITKSIICPRCHLKKSQSSLLCVVPHGISRFWKSAELSTKWALEFCVWYLGG